MISFVPRCWWQLTRCVRLHSRKATLFRLHMKDHHSPLPPRTTQAHMPTSIGFLGRWLGVWPQDLPSFLRLSQDPAKTKVRHPIATQGRG